MLHADFGDLYGFSGSPFFFLYRDSKKEAHLGLAEISTHASSADRSMIHEAAHSRIICGRLNLSDELRANIDLHAIRLDVGDLFVGSKEISMPRWYHGDMPVIHLIHLVVSAVVLVIEWSEMLK